ncbi:MULTISPECIES: FMN-dependent NADH-azoreductase [unclassified Duganella]|uniref:FMN-dependent NADH-azoreductase n=1 Tax=unclassified Duganella TaxID=2636909 RepID=UPI0006F3BD44|nr:MULTISPECIES: NAD(P)H-dependent oxidoreductase [unclassified Duganella]KQV54433.1 NAD(P)H dehydrogenase [Duganella sp. Root336D2]KRC03559.1 NAD(P)H dehydrogenase [Duganella sp. Root198D2]
MTTILHIDSSARPGRSGEQAHGSHTRRLTARFLERYLQLDSRTEVIYRDVGAEPPSPVTGGWVHAAFTPPAAREPWMQEALAQSDTLVDEVLAADIIVAGVPMYNFGPPAQFKAWLDNIVRVGRTFGFDRSRAGEPYWPLLADAGKQLVILSSRGDYGYGPGQRLEGINHVEASVRSVFRYLGVTDAYGAAIEYDEFGDDRLLRSIAEAESATDRLAEAIAATRTTASRRVA